MNPSKSRASAEFVCFCLSGRRLGFDSVTLRLREDVPFEMEDGTEMESLVGELPPLNFNALGAVREALGSLEAVHSG